MAMPAINPYAIQMQQLQRRQALADALMQQSQQPLDTQYTGGANSVAVRRSPFEALAKVAQAAGGAFIQNKNDQKYQDIATQMMAAQQRSLLGLAGDTGAPAGSSGAPPAAGLSSDAGVPPTPSATAPTNLPPPLLTKPRLFAASCIGSAFTCAHSPIRRRLRRPEPGADPLILAGRH